MTAPMDTDRTMLEYFGARSTSTPPDGLLEGALAGVDRTRQRPAWRTLDWWLPSAWADQVTWHGRRIAIVAAVALLILVLIGLAVLAGSGKRLPPPIGPARPGAIVMDVGGDIYLAGPDGRNATKLFGGPHWDGNATFSPDGTKIAFESGMDDKTFTLMVMNADGTGQKSLIGQLWHVDDLISWAPDSRRLAISAVPVEGSDVPLMPLPAPRIVVADVEQGTASFLGAMDIGFEPRWSPDGTMLAYTSDGLWLIRADGSHRHLLTSVAGAVLPVWSPDGTQIAYLGPGAGDEADLFLVGADGSHQRRVTDDPEGESVPSWSPDGTRIAFPKMLDSGNKGELEILEVASGRLTTLHGANVTHDAPVWSPDGTHVLTYVYTKPDNPDHVSQYDTLGIFDVTDESEPVQIPVKGLRNASWQRLAP